MKKLKKKIRIKAQQLQVFFTLNLSFLEKIKETIHKESNSKTASSTDKKDDQDIETPKPISYN